MTGVVVRGHQRGRQLGYPTANVPVSSAELAVPADGVYAGWLRRLDDPGARTFRRRSRSAPTRPSTTSTATSSRTCSTAPTSSCTTCAVEVAFTGSGCAAMVKFDSVDALLVQMAGRRRHRPRHARHAAGAVTDDERRGTIRATEEWFEANGLPYFVAANERRRAWPHSRRARLIPGWPRRLLARRRRWACSSASWSSDVSDGMAVGALRLGAGAARLRLRRRCTFGRSSAGRPQQTFGSLAWLFPLDHARAAAAAAVHHVPVHQHRGLAGDQRARARLPLADRDAVRRHRRRVPARAAARRRSATSASGRGASGWSTSAPDTPLADVAGDVVGRRRRDRAVAAAEGQPGAGDAVRPGPAGDAAVAVGLRVLHRVRAAGDQGLGDPGLARRPGRGRTRSRTTCRRSDWLPVSNELFQVSVFLAAFAGLYFTVYAVTDETYRRQFFTDIADELENGRRRAAGLPGAAPALTAAPGRSRGSQPGTRSRYSSYCAAEGLAPAWAPRTVARTPRRRPRRRRVRQQDRSAQQQGLADDGSDDGDVHRVAHVGVEAAGDELLRGHDAARGCRRPRGRTARTRLRRPRLPTTDEYAADSRTTTGQGSSRPPSQ